MFVLVSLFYLKFCVTYLFYDSSFPLIWKNLCRNLFRRVQISLKQVKFGTSFPDWYMYQIHSCYNDRIYNVIFTYSKLHKETPITYTIKRISVNCNPRNIIRSILWTYIWLTLYLRYNMNPGPYSDSRWRMKIYYFGGF